jgi:hypothetical protein
MTEERPAANESFEHDLRAVLDGMAPREVPELLRTAVAEVPFRITQVHGRRLLPQGRWFAGAVALLAMLVVAFLAVSALRPAATPGNAIPTPHSSIVSGFVEQTDGLYGYQILRPANWTPLGGGLPDGRLYLAPGFLGAQKQGIGVTVVNLQLAAASLGPNEENAEWLLFQQDPSLAGWTAGIEAMWTRDGSSFTLLRTLPHARIYSLSLAAGSPIVVLVAYAIDQGQPLILGLQASGTEADLGRLGAEGIVDDFAAMAGSITAIPENGHNVVPALPTPGPPPPAPS